MKTLYLDASNYCLPKKSDNKAIIKRVVKRDRFVRRKTNDDTENLRKRSNISLTRNI